MVFHFCYRPAKWTVYSDLSGGYCPDSEESSNGGSSSVQSGAYFRESEDRSSFKTGDNREV